MNEQNIIKHYAWLNHNKETEIRLIPINKEEKPFSIFIHSTEELLEVCRNYSGKKHIYIGINERKENGTTKEDIENITNFVIDIDNKGDFFLAQETALKIRADAIAQSYQEPLMICSGNGFHLYFALESIPNNEENRLKIKAFGKKLKEKYEKEGIEIDSAVFEVARVMRLAGTQNIKPEVNRPCFIFNPDKKEVSRINDTKLTKDILNTKIETFQVGELESSISDLIKNDEIIQRLMNGDISGFTSRSEAEESLVCRLNAIGLSKEEIFRVMASCKIGKWQEANIQYRELTFRKSLEIIINRKKQRDNPFRNLHYATEHLKYFPELNQLLGLYGKHYLPLKKARWYQLVGGILQKKIRLGQKETDTRIACMYPLPTEAGKNELIYSFKDIISKVDLILENILSVLLHNEDF